MITYLDAESKELEKIISRKFECTQEVEESVRNILEEVRKKGEKAAFFFTKKFDNANITGANFKVKQEELDRALSEVEGEFIANLEEAANNIWKFHEKQKPCSWLEKDSYGNLLGQIFNPLERIGMYVPGGTAAYPSSVLMNAVPAKAAGVKEIVMASPPSPDGSLNPYTLAAAKIAEVDEIFKIGGAQAVASFAYGAGDLKPVDKITGPGNIYVTAAKKLVYGTVDIDMLAGPSEILIIADKSADPCFVAADMLSQAEHDPLAAALLITTDRELAEKVREEIASQLLDLKRKDTAEESLKNYGAIILAGSLEEAVHIANTYAPEHLELMIEDPFRVLYDIINAGSIFVGEWSPEPVGDYFAGPNHILPTGGTARFYSPVTVNTFLKSSSVIAYKKDSLYDNASKIINLAEIEGLDAHANAVKVRFLKK